MTVDNFFDRIPQWLKSLHEMENELRSAARKGLILRKVSGGVRADPLLADFNYPHPVQRYEFPSQGQALSMAYMDVRPDQPNGKTVVLLHGKNFCGATWEDTVGALREAGYRVVADRADDRAAGYNRDRQGSRSGGDGKSTGPLSGAGTAGARAH